MKKYNYSKIGLNLILASGGIILITYFSKHNYDWVYYLAGIFSVLGLVLSFVGKKQKA